MSIPYNKKPTEKYNNTQKIDFVGKKKGFTRLYILLFTKNNE